MSVALTGGPRTSDGAVLATDVVLRVADETGRAVRFDSDGRQSRTGGTAELLIGVVLATLVHNATVLLVLLAIMGGFWALVNINSLPMVVDTIDDPRLLGTYTGFYYLASQTGSALAPTITGGIIDLFGGNYRSIFFAAPVFFTLAIVFMTLVTRGEAHREPSTVADAVEALGD